MFQRMMSISLILGLLLLSGCGGVASRRMGEVYMYKAVPRDAVIGTNRSSVVYMLRGPGYPANENANRIFDMFNTFGHVGPSLLMDEANHLHEEASREYLIRLKSGEGNSPTAKNLNEIAIESQLIFDDLSNKYSLIHEHDRKREIELVNSIAALVKTRHYINDLNDDLKDLYADLYKDNKWISWSRRKVFLGSKFPLFVKIGGQPLPNDTWTYMAEPGKKWPSDQVSPRWIKDRAFAEYLTQAIPLTLVNVTDVQEHKRMQWAGVLKEVLDANKDQKALKSLNEVYGKFVHGMLDGVLKIKNQNRQEMKSKLTELVKDKTDRENLLAYYDQLFAEIKDQYNKNTIVRQKQLYAQLGKDLHDMVEGVLALCSGLQYQWELLPRISYLDYEGRERENLVLKIPGINDTTMSPDFEDNLILSEDLSELKKSARESGDTQMLENKWRQQVVEVVPYKHLINGIQNGTRSVLYLIEETLNSYKKEMALLARNHADAKVRLESLIKRFDQLVPRHPNRKLLVVNDPKQPPTRLTVMMKTLFIRYLSEGSSKTPPQERGTELLVTCEVESANDFGDSTVMPLVYEPHYAPSNFVNVRDRIIYGPRTYKGDFFNVKISIVELDDLNNSAISSGLDQAVDVVGKAQPELAAISPFVSTLFKGITNSLMENDIELKFEFTIPGPEGKGKADVDMLVAETGHYIILKRENDSRKEYEVENARKRYGPNDLIYNPEDGLLYFRLDMENPKNNFTPDNLFKNQTYAVLVVTDEYAAEDNLGQALRKRLSQALGEDRSRELIPDMNSARNLLDNYASTQNEMAVPAGASLDGRSQRLRLKQVQGQQDSLWSSNSDLNKTLIVRSLYEQAAPRAKELLQEDVEAWKKAILIIGENGLIDVE